MSSPRAPFQSPTPAPRQAAAPLRLSGSPPAAGPALTQATSVGSTIVGARPSYEGLLRSLRLSTRSRSSSPIPISIPPRNPLVIPELNIIPPTPALPSAFGLLPAFDIPPPPIRKRTRTKSVDGGRHGSDVRQPASSVQFPSTPSDSVPSPLSSPSDTEYSPGTPASSTANVTSPDTPFTPPISTPPAPMQPFSPHPSRDARRRHSTGASSSTPPYPASVEKGKTIMDMGMDGATHPVMGGRKRVRRLSGFGRGKP